MSEDKMKLLEKLILYGKIEKDLKIGNFVFTVKTMSDEENRELYSNMVESENKIERSLKIRKELIARSITKINGIEVSYEDIVNIISKWQFSLVEKIIDFINDISKEQSSFLSGEEIKN